MIQSHDQRQLRVKMVVFITHKGYPSAGVCDATRTIFIEKEHHIFIN